MSTERLHILVTNDDGISSPGIKALCHALKDFAQVSVVAPAYEQSAVGLSMTVRSPLHIEQVCWPEAAAWSVTGTPADCVKMAVSVILENRPDYIVSGINRGGNAGRNLLYSGTVAGAIEGTFQNIPSVAFSCWDYHHTDYSTAAAYVPAVMQHIIDHPLPEGTLLNVNFPTSALPFQGIKLTRQGKGYWAEKPDKRFHPTEQSSYYWLGIQLAEFEEEEDCDVMWLKKGFATAVPIQVAELTNHQMLSSHRSLFNNKFIVN